MQNFQDIETSKRVIPSTHNKSRVNQPIKEENQYRPVKSDTDRDCRQHMAANQSRTSQNGICYYAK